MDEDKVDIDFLREYAHCMESPMVVEDDMEYRRENLHWLQKVWPMYRRIVQKKLWDFECNYRGMILWAMVENKFSLSEMLWASGALITYR